MLDYPKRLRITLEQYDAKIAYELPHNDYEADDLIDFFKHILVTAGYPPSILDPPES